MAAWSGWLFLCLGWPHGYEALHAPLSPGFGTGPVCETPAKFDLSAEPPLPPGASQRLGLVGGGVWPWVQAISADGSRFAACESGGRRLAVYQTDPLRLTHQFEPPPGAKGGAWHRVRFAAAGRLAGEWDGRIGDGPDARWKFELDPADGTCQRSGDEPVEKLRSDEASGDGKWKLIWDHTRGGYLVEPTAGGAAVRVPHRIDHNAFWDKTLSPDGRWLVLSSYKRVQVARVGAAEPLADVAVTGSARHVCFLPGGGAVRCVGHLGMVTIDLTTGAHAHAPLPQGDHSLDGSGRYLLSMIGRRFALRDLDTGREVAAFPLEAYSGYSRWVFIEPTLRYVFLGGSRLTVYRLRDGSVVNPPTGFEGRVEAVHGLPGGRWLTHTDRAIMVWDGRTGRCLRRATFPGEVLRGAAPDRGGVAVAVFTADEASPYGGSGLIRLLDPETLSERKRLRTAQTYYAPIPDGAEPGCWRVSCDRVGHFYWGELDRVVATEGGLRVERDAGGHWTAVPREASSREARVVSRGWTRGQFEKAWVTPTTIELARRSNSDERTATAELRYGELMYLPDSRRGVIRAVGFQADGHGRAESWGADLSLERLELLPGPARPSAGRFVTPADDGRLFVTVRGTKLEACEVFTGASRFGYDLPGEVGNGEHRWRGPVAVSPDGLSVATALCSGELLVWPLRPKVRTADVAPTPAGWARVYFDLKSDDGPTVEAALRTFQARPVEAVAFLAKELPQRKVPFGLGELDERLDAMLRLEGVGPEDAERAVKPFGPAAVPGILKRLRALPALMDGERESIDASRLALALSRARLLGHPGHDGEKLRHMRAVEALERIGTPEARKLLGELAERGGSPTLVLEAMLALE